MGFGDIAKIWYLHLQLNPDEVKSIFWQLKLLILPKEYPYLQFSHFKKKANFSKYSLKNDPQQRLWLSYQVVKVKTDKDEIQKVSAS